MDVTKILFDTVSSLTGGLITDMTTLLVALLALQFIIFGLSWLRDSFEAHIDKRKTNKLLEDARYYDKMANSMDDKVSRDYFQAKYNSAIGRASK